MLLILDRHTQPDVGGNMVKMLLANFQEVSGSLRENLKGVPSSLAHHLKHLLNELHWDVLVEQITHGIDENYSRLLPS